MFHGMTIIQFYCLMFNLNFYLDYGGAGKICGLGELSCLQRISEDLRKISQGHKQALKELKDEGIDCACPSGIRHTLQFNDSILLLLSIAGSPKLTFI